MGSASLRRPGLAPLSSWLRGPATDHRTEVVRYLIVGGCGYMLGLAMFAGLVAVGLSPYVALPPVFVANGLFNFALNRAWSFPRSGRPLRQELGRFCVIAALSLVVNYTALYLLHDVIALAAVPAQAAAILIATPVGFLGNKLWSFGPADPKCPR